MHQVLGNQGEGFVGKAVLGILRDQHLAGAVILELDAPQRGLVAHGLSPTSKPGFIVARQGIEGNNKIRFCAMMSLVHR